MDKNLKNTLIIFLGCFLISLFSNTLSPFITTIKNTYNVSNGVIAMLPSVVYCASFIISIFGVKFMLTFGLKRGLYLSFLFVICTSFVILLSKSFYVLLIGYFISGLACGLSSILLSTYISLLPKKYQKFSLLNACFGLGGILILPIDRFILKNKINFNYTYLVHIIALTLFLVLISRLDSISIHKTTSKHISTLTVLKNPLVLSIAIAIFFYVGAEISTTSWAGNFLERYYGLSRIDVPNILLGFWILFTLGRALGDKLLEKVGQLKFLSIAPIISSLGILILLLGKTRFQAVLGIAIIGLSISLIYPALQGYIMQHVSKEAVPAASVIVMNFNYLGAMFLTYLIGLAGGIKVTYVFIIQFFFYAYIVIIALKYLLLKPKS
ncbi:MFS transporter [Clostridium hydrogenum]|uniref:MFS transporter n=1 Tax=Clostridium hydrogenum TaxID=2855764 RepID=UPI001F16B0E2|nr:MFS transporter [Clostridium hydrogenum]